MITYREARKKERLEREVKELKQALESRQAEIRSKQAAATQAEEHVARLEQMLKEAQVSYTALLGCLLPNSIASVLSGMQQVA